MLLRLLLLYWTASVIVFARRHVRNHPRDLGQPLKSHQNETTPDAPVCDTKACHNIANMFKGNMDQSADPCEDFYQYACGNWDKNNPMPPDAKYWSSLSKLQRTVTKQAKDLLKQASERDEWKPVKLAKRFYRSCMDEERREKEGIGPLAETVSRLGGWPLMMDKDDWAEDYHRWQKIDDFYTDLIGLPTFHEIYATINYRTDQLMLLLYNRGLPPGSSRIFTESDEDITDEVDDSEEKDSEEVDSQEANSQENSAIADDGSNRKKKKISKETYAKLVSEVAMALAEYMEYDVDKAHLSKSIDEMLKFMELLHKIIEGEPIERGSTTFESVKELHGWYNKLDPVKGNAKINWIDSINSLLEEAKIDSSKNIEIRISDRKYFENLRALLEMVPSRVIVNYVHWRFISKTLPYLNAKMRQLHKEITGNEEEIDYNDYGIDLPGETDSDDLDAECTNAIRMTDVLSFMFVKKYFPEEVLNKAEEMVTFVQEEVKKQIQQSEWLDKGTRKMALQKVEGVNKLIGYPKLYNNATAYRKLYSGLLFDNSYFENALNYHRHQTRMRLSSMSSIAARSLEDYMMPLMVNAMYALNENSIFLSAADFQDPFFALMRPSIINYGIIGVIVGHEINHGFDDNGKRFDSRGNPIEWLTEMLSQYEDRVECFINQYGNYTNSTDFGTRTRNENIADTMGLEASLGGYYLSKEREKDTPMERLPGFETFTTEQLYFLSYANLQCETETKLQKEKLKFDAHSTGKLRTIGAISNSEQFGKAYNCPVGSRMNPEEKCNIWN